MNKVQNIFRFWVDEGSGIIVRDWTDEEYKTLDPHTHIFETYWTYYCPRCGFLPTPYSNEKEVKYSAKLHEMRTPGDHRCIVEYRKFELACLETREEFREDLGVWVCVQEKY